MTANQALLGDSAKMSASQVSMDQAVHYPVHVTLMQLVSRRLDAVSALLAKQAMTVQHHVSLGTGAKTTSVNASAERYLWAVTQSLVGVPVRPASAETTVRRSV